MVTKTYLPSYLCDSSDGSDSSDRNGCSNSSDSSDSFDSSDSSDISNSSDSSDRNNKAKFRHKKVTHKKYHTRKFFYKNTVLTKKNVFFYQK